MGLPQMSNLRLPPATECLVERHEIERDTTRSAVGERKLGLLQIPLRIEHIEKGGDTACVALTCKGQGAAKGSGQY